MFTALLIFILKTTPTESQVALAKVKDEEWDGKKI